MSYHQVLIKKSEKISIKHGNIRILKNNQTEIDIPIEDVSIILIEDPHTVLTVRFITECNKNYICIVLCDETYTPVTVINSFSNHYNQLNLFYKQLMFDENKNLWNQIIKQKITNQISVIKHTINDNNAIELLQGYLPEIVNGDIKNRESTAARVYFSCVFGSEFIRFYDDGVNAGLNYGYKVLASAVIRSLISLGVDPKIGIWHDSKSNQFNLAYDLIEPFRPIVDYFIYNYELELSSPLSFTIRKKLIDVLNYKLIINEKLFTVQNAIDQVVRSYIKALEGNTEQLVLPEIPEIDFITYE